MGKLFVNYKCCQNCRYWNGERKINGIAKTTESSASKSKCQNPKGFYNQDMSNLSMCNNFEPVI